MRARVLEEVHFAEVVGNGHDALVVGAAQGVDVSSIRAIWPHAYHSSRPQPDLPAPTRGPELHHFPPSSGSPATHPPRSRQSFPVPRAGGAGVGEASWAGSASFLTSTPYNVQHSEPQAGCTLSPHTHASFHGPVPLLTVDMEAQHAGVGGPLPVSALIAIPQQLTASSHVPWGEGAHPAQFSPSPPWGG